ncbi:MAG: SDR family oxidoreductase [Bacteroidetes bacterium]|nr:SDR family oxidoreductase [Bacteroidota bacterium]
MDLGIKNKKALIMASSKGLGKSVALELAREGAEVMICGRTETDLIETANEISQINNAKVYYVVGDVSIASDRHKILTEAKSKMGMVDILVTNSGGPPFGDFDQHNEQDWEQAYRLLLESVVGMIKRVLPDMKKQKWGRIISITSQAVKQPVEGLILSNSIRASVVGLVKTLSNELGAYNITVNNVMPGYTQTKRLENLIAKNPNLLKITEEIPLGRIGKPEEFAAAVVFLASERASYITGVSLPVDGGWIKGI